MKSFKDFVNPTSENGLYMKVKYSENSLELVKKLQEKLQLKNPVSLNKIHTTVVYSRKHVDIFPSLDVYEKASIVGLDVWDTKYGKTVVAFLDSPYLHERFNDAMEAGATYDYPDYKPHITLSYDAGNDVFFDFKKYTVQFPIDLFIVSEHTEELDFNIDLVSLTEYEHRGTYESLSSGEYNQ
ncbi:hypothetical protein POP12_087 [Pectobacterium phage POP12]|nr:hypothetical protein POP12_087 [Pectobacterium phage POP12]